MQLLNTYTNKSGIIVQIYKYNDNIRRKEYTDLKGRLKYIKLCSGKNNSCMNEVKCNGESCKGCANNSGKQEFKNRKNGEIFIANGKRYKKVGNQSKQLCIGDNNTCMTAIEQNHLCQYHQDNQSKTSKQKIREMQGTTKTINTFRYIYRDGWKRLCIHNNNECVEIVFRRGRCRYHYNKYKLFYDQYIKKYDKYNYKQIKIRNYINDAIEVHGNIYNYSKFKPTKIKEKSIIICYVHGEFLQSYEVHVRLTCGCPKCGTESMANSKRKDLSTFIEQAIQVHGKIYNYSLVDYINRYSKVKIICDKRHSNGKKHGIFKQSPANHLAGKGCKKCKTYSGEDKIKNILSNNKIKYQEQKTFPDCKDKQVLHFDFYLPEHNILIEYDGEQHFNYKSYFGGYGGLLDRMCKDKIKNDYCAKNKISLLRISYSISLNDLQFYILRFMNKATNNYTIEFYGKGYDANYHYYENNIDEIINKISEDDINEINELIKELIE